MNHAKSEDADDDRWRACPRRRPSSRGRSELTRWFPLAFGFGRFRLRDLRGFAPVLCFVACLTPSIVSAQGGVGSSVSPAPADVWQAVSQLLAQPLVLCFLVIAVGMGLGSLRLGGMSLGTSGVLFSALLFGHFGQQEGWSMPDLAGTLGLVLFVYAVGLGAGSTFFRAFRDQGKQLAFLGLVTVSVGALTAVVLTSFFRIPGDLATGVFAGALTSTPALAAGIQAAEQAGQPALAVSIGYGMAYPVGVIAVVLFVQLVPRLLRVNLDMMGRQLQAQAEGKQRIDRYLVKIRNPAIFHKSLNDVPLLEGGSWQITRVLEGNRLVPIKPHYVFQENDVVLLVTDEKNADILTMVLGERTEEPVLIDSDHDRADVVVTSPELLNKSLRQLHLRSRYGVTIARIERYGVSFVPNADTCFSMADRTTAVGEPEGLRAFEKAAGHRIRKLHETDLMSVGLGLVFGLLLGMVPIRIPGLGEFQFGLAGGPLLSGLLFAHYGRFMGIVGYMPIAARMLTQELGLALFLAAAGFQAGGHFLEMLEKYGVAPFAISLTVALVSMSTAFLVGRFVLHMNLMQVLGGTCGAMTSTAGIGAIVNKTDCDVPVTSYAAAYPAALVLMTVLAQLLMSALQR